MLSQANNRSHITVLTPKLYLALKNFIEFMVFTIQKSIVNIEMNTFYDLLLEQFKLFSSQHPTLGLIGVAAGLLLLVGVTWFRINYSLQEKAISLNTQRFQTLIDLIRADDVEVSNPLYLELAFQKAFRRKISRDQIVFALKHRNPTNLLFDMWYGRSLVKLDNERIRFVLKRKQRFSLNLRERLLDTILYFLATPGFMLAVCYSFFNPTIGLLFVAEFTLFFWILLSSGRAIACARRLLDGEYANELRTA